MNETIWRSTSRRKRIERFGRSSPHRKARASFRFPGFGFGFRGSAPRRSRVVLVSLVCLCVYAVLLPKSSDLGSGIGRTLLFLVFSPGVADYFFGGRDKGFDVLGFIDPFIGTTNGGHVFPGATLPYGMAKPVADTDSHGENAAGFVSDDHAIIGFSHLHDSGTGGSPSLGNFPLFVHPGCPADDVRLCAFAATDRPVARVAGSARARPGYFAVDLANAVRAEMTATAHAALYRFSFPGTPAVTVPWRNRTARPPQQHPVDVDVPYGPVVLVDLMDLAATRILGKIQVEALTTTGKAGENKKKTEPVARIFGEGRYRPSFGSGLYDAYFCADFAGAPVRRTGTFASGMPTEGDNYHEDLRFGSAGAWVQFGQPFPGSDDSILARVGVSFISVDQACENAEREVPDFDFARVEGDARQAWREKLATVEVDPVGISTELQTVFWSGLYRSLLSPQNYTGENPRWNSTEPYFDSFYCIWDSFRAQHPLLTIIDPVAQTQMVRALIDIYRHEGKLPDCRMAFCKGYTQGGSNADVVIADAFIKGLTDGIDWETAYEAVVSDAEVEPHDWGVEGRGNLESWHRLGYIPRDDIDTNGTGPSSRTISRGLEYAYDDYCIGLMARGMGHAADAAKYHARSANWKHYWNPTQRDLFVDPGNRLARPVTQSSFQGFPQPRFRNGTFAFQNTRTCSPVQQQHACYYDTRLDTYEGSPWLYSFFVPQDMAALIDLMSETGADGSGFVERLNHFHTSGVAYLGNEQSFLPVFQFHYAGRPGLSSYWAHRYVPGLFNASVNGIPGNDDGAMGAFAAFVMMGFFPVAGQDVYLLTPPFFREVRLRATDITSTSPKGRSRRRRKSRDDDGWAIIRVRNFDATTTAYEQGMYIKSATLDGVPYTRSWITHDFFRFGGVLELVVGRTEGFWGSRVEDLPPSDPPPSRQPQDQNQEYDEEGEGDET